jgi:hypothetical protein
MSTHRYAPRDLIPDYARGLTGAAVSGGALTLVPSTSVTALVLAALTALFMLFTIRTALRQRTRVEVTDRSISSRPGPKDPLTWNEIDGIRLRYYSTRRARDRGWMTLKLMSRRRSIVVDSNLEGFEAILARAAEAASRNRLDLSDTTRANFAALGFPVEDAPGDAVSDLGADTRGDDSPRSLRPGAGAKERFDGR